jgi:hypothetical protein
MQRYLIGARRSQTNGASEGHIGKDTYYYKKGSAILLLLQDYRLQQFYHL